MHLIHTYQSQVTTCISYQHIGNFVSHTTKDLSSRIRHKNKNLIVNELLIAFGCNFLCLTAANISMQAIIKFLNYTLYTK